MNKKVELQIPLSMRFWLKLKKWEIAGFMRIASPIRSNSIKKPFQKIGMNIIEKLI